MAIRNQKTFAVYFRDGEADQEYQATHCQVLDNGCLLLVAVDMPEFGQSTIVAAFSKDTWLSVKIRQPIQ